MKDTQCERLIKYLLVYKKITMYQAFNKLGIGRLSARVYDLRKSGYIIDGEMTAVKNRYGETVKVMEYTLVGMEEGAA